MTLLPLKMMEVCQSVYIATMSTLQHTAIFPWERVTSLGAFRIIELFLHTSNPQTSPKTFTGSTGTGPPGTQRQISRVTREHKCISETLRCNRPRAANFKGCNKRQRVLPFLLCFHFAHISINERSLVIPEFFSESMFWPVLAFRCLEALQGGPLMHVVMTEH